MKTQYFPFVGGLNTTSPPVTTRPGELLDCINYECSQTGGYRRIKGYAEFIGQVPGEGPILGVHIFKGVVYAFRDNATQGVMYRAENDAWVALPYEFAKSGRYQCVNFNFFGQDDMEEMFIANGREEAVKFDGTTFVKIVTGDEPFPIRYVAAWDNRLALAIDSSVFLSATGEPLNFDASVTDAIEIALGDTITNLEVSQGVLIVGCRNSTQVIYEEGLRKLNNTGTMPFTLQNVGGQLLGLDAGGLMSLSASNAFGDFVYSSISERVRDRLVRLRQTGTPVSTISKSLGQYRLFAGKEGLYFSMSGQDLLGIGATYFDHPVLCVHDGEDTNGQELIVFGSEDGYVYQMDSGNTFAGQHIFSMALLNFSAVGLPTLRKRFRQMNIEARIDGQTVTFMTQALTDYGGGLPTGAEALDTNPGLWNVGVWDEMTFDSVFISELKVRLNCAGKSFAFLMVSENETDQVHELLGATLHYSDRRLVR
jgi:hypothetical protein